MNSSVREQMDVIKQLVAADEEIRKLDLLLGSEREGLEATKKDLAKVREQIERERAQYDDLEADRGAKQQEARQLANQLDRSREKLNRARNEKESNAVQREIEETRKLVRDVEDAIGKRVLELEALKKSIIDHEEAEAGHATKLGEAEGAASQRLGAVEADRAAKAASRDEIAKRLPAPLLRKYDQVRQRRGSGAALLAAGRCKACNIGIPPQQAQRVSRIDAMEQCPSCNRFLFVDPQPTPSTPPPETGAGT